MTYLLMSLPFLTAAVVAAWLTRPRERAAARRRWVAVAVAAGVLVLLTAVFDSVIIGTGIVAYDDAHRLGWTIGLAPVEDFLYPLAGVLLLPAVWSIAARRWPPRHAAGAGTEAAR
ncbi:lycopene cyclase domain-containing protein [Agromyces aurantiacus]|uniref:Lycopene cyclase domain-containing protein n=1 Tax=Agromyces aurantiacus TaxID=165814 RepID=A0ABV9R911_9MICO|nr:lycopene cyclase domain-containing protein [Agromyces aurantiacus]MBM7504567.1 lycopene cyclase domain-containing protein [Agromyces aurantiacus]